MNPSYLSHPLVLLIVTDKVLDGSTNSLALKTVDVGSGNLTRVGRVFRERFESSTTEGRSLDVDGRGKEADCVSGLGLFGQQFTSLFGKGLGKGSSDTGGIGECGSGS